MLKGKSAIVTGSTSGIGLGIAEALAKEGVNLVINGSRATPEAEALRARLASQYGVKVAMIAADLSAAAAVEAFVRQAVEAIGPIDILVNNAGIQHVCPVEDFPVEKWDQIIALNLSAAFHTTRLVVKGMKERGWGRIVNVASAHALVASPFKSAYVSAKHGILGLTKTVALETAEHGVTVNAVCPGYVLTPLVEKQIPDTAKARGMTIEQVKRDVLLAAQPTKQFVTVEQVAATTVFLCTDGAASITGTHIAVEGGWAAH
ncbi:MAG TPA: 3-hydroxybutyrate dehydrogenase [Usitatibacteraceae bacterium]|nr:3-hydroxybutyrate dehydrogenase [Usitatibacteraceae bacterium]